MAKMCRTCESASRELKCVYGWWCEEGHSICGEHKPREMPLLVDALAIAGKLLLEKMDNIGDGMLFNLDILDAREVLRKAVARHQKEVGDAKP